MRGKLSPKIPDGEDIKRQLIEQLVNQQRLRFEMQAYQTGVQLRTLAENTDLSNPHIQALFANAVSALQNSTEELALLTRSDLERRFGIKNTLQTTTEGNVIEGHLSTSPYKVLDNSTQEENHE